MFLLFSAMENKAETKIEYNLPTQYDVGDCVIQQSFTVVQYALPLTPHPIMPSSMVEGFTNAQLWLPDKYGLTNNKSINLYNRPTVANFNCPVLVPWSILPSYQTGYQKISNYFATYGLAN